MQSRWLVAVLGTRRREHTQGRNATDMLKGCSKPLAVCCKMLDGLVLLRLEVSKDALQPQQEFCSAILAVCKPALDVMQIFNSTAKIWFLEHITQSL